MNLTQTKQIPFTVHENERDNLKRLMKKYPSVVAEYYQSNQTLAENYITETYWEEDVERWLDKIRARSPSKLFSEIFKLQKSTYIITPFS